MHHHRSLITILVVVILYLFLHWLGFTKGLDNTTTKMLTPVIIASNKISATITKPFSYFFTAQQLSKENEQLRSTNVQLTAAAARNTILEDELADLKKQLGYVKTNKIKYQAAEIIGQAPAADNIVIINEGARSGLQVNLPVIANEGVLVGKVVKVEDNQAQVQLLTDTNSKIAASLQNSEQTSGLVTGQHGLSLSMEQVPQDQVANEGDLIITSGLEGSIPRGLLIGAVDKIIKTAGNFWQTIVVKPAVNYTGLHYVLILLP